MGKALVLGGDTGLLGQALVRLLQRRGWETESLGRKNGDLQNFSFLQKKIGEAKADVVFNTIAWTRVDDAEDFHDEATGLNRAFPDAVARALANTSKGHMIHFSTDFVFSGEHQAPWKENDTPRPANIYGLTKLEGERAVLEILPDRSCVIRTAWLFGSGKKNFISTILSAASARDVISVVDDQVGSPTFTDDLALWSILLAEKQATGIWHGVNSGQASWCELASEAVHLASIPCHVEPIPSVEWPQKAIRPANSVLDNSKLANFLGQKPRPWPVALRDYIFGDFLEKQEGSQS